MTGLCGWETWNPDVRIIVFVSLYRAFMKPLVEFIDRVDRHFDKQKTITVLLPEFITP